MIEILMKILAKIRIIVVENRVPYYFIISLFSYQMLASTFDSDERCSYYKVYGLRSLISLEFRHGLACTIF